MSTRTSHSTVARIKTANHHLRIAADQVSDGILILETEPLTDRGPRIVYVNRSLTRMTGYKIEEVLGHSLSLLFDRQMLDGFLRRLPMVARAGRAFRTTSSVNCADGQRRYCEWTVRPVNDTRGRTLNYTITLNWTVPESPEEIPVVVKKNGKLGAAIDRNEMLKKCKMESLALVASGIAHDFNNLLTAVIGCLDLTRHEAQGNNGVNRHLDEAAEALESAQGLTKQLLAFARGGARSRKAACLGELLSRSSRISTFGSNVECNVEYPDDLKLCEVDESQVMQVFNNLIINARQAMNDAGVISVWCEETEVDEDSGVDLEPGEYVVVAVRDRGCGIPEEALRNIFNAFYTTKKEGTGLGLAMCQSIVREHKGDIVVTSKEGKGTKFKLYFPVSKSQEPQVRTVAPESAFPPIGGDSCVAGSVLVVDDQDGVRSVACAIIEKLGYEVCGSANGEDAVRLYQDSHRAGDPYSVVLLDMTLPGGMSGSETMEEIRKIDPTARVIATSGYFEEDTIEELKCQGYLNLLPKPYTAEQLSGSLRDAVNAVVK